MGATARCWRSVVAVPMHAAGLADMYGLSQVVVPAASQRVLGAGLPDGGPELPAAAHGRLVLDGLCLATLAGHLDALRATAMAPLLAAGSAAESVTTTYVALMRYAAQSDTTAVPFALPLDPAALHADFQARHHQLFGYSTAEPLRDRGLAGGGARGLHDPGGGAQARIGRRRCAAQPGSAALPGRAGASRRAIIARDTLTHAVDGPAIIAGRLVDRGVPPGWRAVPDLAGHLRMARGAA